MNCGGPVEDPGAFWLQIESGPFRVDLDEGEVLKIVWIIAEVDSNKGLITAASLYQETAISEKIFSDFPRIYFRREDDEGGTVLFMYDPVSLRLPPLNFSGTH